MNKTENEENLQYQYIDTPALLEDLLSHLRPQRTIALDTEADSFHHHRPKVCLIQLSFDDKTYIVDPLAPIEVPALLDIIADKELIIHDAGYDLRMLGGDYGFKPKNGVFDTMLAAALTGMKNVGLSALLEHILDLKVAKHNQKADWSKRPLSAHLLQYAAEDTASLMQVKSYLADHLTELGRADWHTESCVAAVEAAQNLKDTADPDNEWRIKGTGELSFKEMAFLRQVWYWRENIAKETNIAPFMICRNEEMIKLARWAARRKKPIEDESKFPIRHKSNKSKTLLKALQKAQALGADQWPGSRKSDPSKRLSNTTRNTVNKLKAECEKIAQQHDLPLNLIASRAALTRIVLDNATTLEQIQNKNILLNWQATLLLPAIGKVLNQSTL